MSTKRPRGTTFTTDHKSPTSYHGFTLIELLIVVAIIAILISIGLTSYSQAQRQGRDSKRKGDLATVANALEQFYSDNNRYPITSSSGDGRIKCKNDNFTPPNPPTYSNLDWGQDQFDCDFDGGAITSDPAVVYFGFLPGDPTTSSPQPQYYYEALEVDGTTTCNTEGTLEKCQRFILAAVLENTNDPDVDPTCFSDGGDVYNYCVYNP